VENFASPSALTDLYPLLAVRYFSFMVIVEFVVLIVSCKGLIVEVVE
jgi:hypothetical protein